MSSDADTTNLCPICGEGQVREVTYIGVVEDLPMKYSECDTCMSEFSTPEQMRHNKLAFDEMKRRGRKRNEENK